MRIPDWRRLFCLPKRHPIRAQGSSQSRLSPKSTTQDAPISVLRPLSPPPPAATNEISTVNPDSVLSLPPAPSVLPLPTVPDLVPTTSSPAATATNRDIPLSTAVLIPASSSPPAVTASTNSVARTVGNGLVVALKLLKEAVTGVGVPGLEATVSGVVGVIDLIKDVKDNAAAFDGLDGLISDLAQAIRKSADLHQEVLVPTPLQSRVTVFMLELHGMLMKVQQMIGDENVVVRAANSQAHKDAIEDINARLLLLLNRFSMEGVLSLELGMAGARQDIRYVIEAQKAREYEDRINAIPRVHARYNDTSTKPSRPCHSGTRVDLLHTIRKWIYGGRGTTPYFWLCGEVGVGKTTVAHTIAQENEALQQLGASFFFSRHDDGRRTPYLLFTSIAYQLARYDEGFYKALAEILKPDPDIVKRTPREQFKQLVLQPLEQSGIDSSRTVVIVIDGLDECSDPASILDVLTLGVNSVAVHLRVLISSRPYAMILSKFKDPRLYHLTSETQFRDVDPKVLSDDVTAYLSWELGALASRSQLPSPWPPKAQLDELIQRAAGLFIVASTYTKYLEDPEVGNPGDQLKRLLSRQKRVGASPLAELDALYDQVLEDLKSRLPSDMVMARNMLGIIIYGKDNINIEILAGLLAVDPSDVRLVLRHLTAVIPLPENDDAKIIPFHASFGEYAQDSTRYTVRELLVQADIAHGQIAFQCSNAIASAAKEGIIGVEYDSASGDPWIPAYLKHAVSYLHLYLSHSHPVQVEEVRKTIIKVGIWTVFHIMSARCTVQEIVRLIDAVGGLEGLLRIKGSSANARSASLGTLMIADYIAEMNQMPEKAATASEKVEVEASQLMRGQALEFVNISHNGLDGALKIVRNVRCWMRYNHSNVMSFRGTEVKYDDDNAPEEVLVLVASPVSIQHSSSLHTYLKRSNNLDLTSVIRLALGIADGLRHLHGASPPQPHNGLDPHKIMVSEEGHPILYPSSWHLEFHSKLPSDVRDDDDEITRDPWVHSSWRLEWDHWNPVAGKTWKKSVQARLSADVWDFGCVLYQIITGDEPYYFNPAKRRVLMDYSARIHGEDISHSEPDVLSFLAGLQVDESVKGLLKSCWAIRPRDRPTMGEVFERLKVMRPQILGHPTKSPLFIPNTPQKPSTSLTTPLLKANAGPAKLRCTLISSDDEVTDGRVALNSPRSMHARRLSEASAGSAKSRHTLPSPIHPVMFEEQLPVSSPSDDMHSGPFGPNTPRKSSTILSAPGRKGSNMEEKFALRPSRLAVVIPKLKKLQPTQHLIEHSGLVRHLQFSPDGKWLATCSWDRTAIIWKVGEPFQPHKILAHPGAGFISQVAWSPDGGKYLLTKMHKAVKVWMADTGVLFKTINRDHHIDAVTWLPSGRVFACVEQNHIHIADLQGTILDTHSFRRGQIHDVSFTPDEERMLLVGTLELPEEGLQPTESRAEETILVYSLAGKKVENKVLVSAKVRGVSITSDGSLALVSYEDRAPPEVWAIDIVANEGRLRLLKTYMPTIPVNFAGPSYFCGVEDQFVICAGTKGDIHIWDRETGLLLHSLQGANIVDGGAEDLTGIAWNHHAPGQFMFASATHDGTVRIWTAQAPPETAPPSRAESPAPMGKMRSFNSGGISIAT